VHTGSSVFQSPARSVAPIARWSYEAWDSKRFALDTMVGADVQLPEAQRLLTKAKRFLTFVDWHEEKK
jgi:hypothetical protein